MTSFSFTGVVKASEEFEPCKQTIHLISNVLLYVCVVHVDLLQDGEDAQRVVEAEAEAEIRRVTAEAEAYEILQRAEAEAQANQKLAESITDRLIEYRYYEVWDGKLPQMVMGESTTPMVQIP